MSRNFRNIKLYLREIDRPLFLLLVSIVAISIFNMYGVVGGDSPIFKKHAIFMGVGLLVAIIFSFFNYRYLKNYSLFVFAAYLLSILLLVLTFYSQSVRGTNSWLILGSLTFEPAELTKLCLIILMAKYFSQRHVHINQVRHLLASGVYFVVPAIIMISQPDLGSAIILGLLWGSLLLAVGINKRHLSVMIVLGMIISYSAWMLVLEPYQKVRIFSFLNQGSDPYGSGYNLIQSKIAIGSGSWFGNGFGKGSQSSLGFLPEPHNDFIFAAFIEQFGLAGASSLLAIMLAMVYRILNIGSAIVSNFGKLFAIGLAVLIFSHVFVSAGVNIGILPITGLPFSFLSSGGSHLFSVMAGLGILQSIKRYG